MRSRLFLLGILIVVAVLALTGCEALDEISGTPGTVTPGIETEETPGLATPGAGTPEATVGIATPEGGVPPTEQVTDVAPETTPEAGATEGITPGAEVTATAEVTPGAEITPTEAVTPETALTPDETISPDVGITPTRTATPGAGIIPTETVTPGAEIKPTGTVSPGGGVTGTAPIEAPQELRLVDLDTLEQFDSYQTMTIVTWTPESEAPTLIEALVEARMASGLEGIGREVTQHTVITLTQGDQPMQTLEFVSRGDQTWTRLQGAWSEVAVAPTDLLDQIGWVGNPEVLTSGDARGDLVGVETVEGMELWHYRFPYDAISQEQRFAEFSDAELDVWMSPAFNVLWRAELNATGTGPQERTGELELLSQIVEVDQPVEFELPPELEAEAAATPGTTGTPQAGVETPGALPQTGQEAPAVLARNDIPLIEGATNVRVLGNVVVMDVPRAPSEVISWYTDELEGGEWSISDPRSDTSAQLVRDGDVVNIVAAPAQREGQSIVIVTVGEE